ncbi:nucleotide exchange factor GrpE [Thiorhodococcus mannitoliphagus]|uniref:Nucleotide exchange factor GrpE n=1 Tax=Thiorhodococcus mannitoliphagus TaxID=329406 RepID=A0A6P1DXQ3_9GAMM|nr:nucleotide exchange factor GrpE [Thiorhodococcus mannitoliphagus]NEX22978.1 nucleotide exchange factor GrpE [Thiorhodococcus mannitoliphagus]
MSAKKERLRDRLVELQRTAIGLSTELDAYKRKTQDNETDLFLDLVGVLDAFENLFNNLSLDTLDKSTKRAFKSVGAIQRKLTRLLEARGIARLEFPDGRAQVGRCKVIETRATDEVEEGTILAVVRNGYRRGEQVLRPAEVITASRSQTPAETPQDRW